MANLNALAPTNDINTMVGYANKFPKKIRPELFYNKVLLDTIRLGSEHFVHYRLADTKPIQGRAEKLQLRRWSALSAHTVPLEEGVPPKSDRGAVESYELGVHQYGRYMEFTDKVDFEAIDPIVAHYTSEYSIVAMETLDLLAREALLAVPNVYFAGMAEDMGAMVIGDKAKPALNDLRIIALGMKKRLVKPRKNGNYMVICTPDVTFDLVSDPIVEKYLTINQTTKSVYTDSVIPPLFGLEFYETMHTDDTAVYTTTVGDGNHVTKAMKVYRVAAGGDSYEYETVYEKKSEDGTDSGYYVKKENIYTGDGYNFKDAELNAIPVAYTWDLDKFNTAKSATDNPYVPLNVHKVLVIGAGALIRTNVDGRDNAKMYVKPLGSAGVLDPINQRQSIGFKIDAVGFGVERNEAVAIYNCIPTQANA